MLAFLHACEPALLAGGDPLRTSFCHQKASSTFVLADAGRPQWLVKGLRDSHGIVDRIVGELVGRLACGVIAMILKRTTTMFVPSFLEGLGQHVGTSHHEALGERLDEGEHSLTVQAGVAHVE